MAGALALLALVVPASASAHTPAAQVSCNGADFSWTAFAGGPNTVHWRVTVDGATFREGTTQIGSTGTLHVPYTLNNSHTVEAFSWWAANETSDGNVRSPNAPAIAHAQLNCPAPPPPPPPPPPAPPASTPPPATSTPPAVAPAPTTVVAGTQAARATARVAVQRSCAARSARVTITGSSIRRATFFVNGRRVRTVTVRTGARRLTVSVPLSQGGPARQRVQVRFTFRNGAPARVLNTTARRCAQAAVQPQFTG